MRDKGKAKRSASYSLVISVALSLVISATFSVSSAQNLTQVTPPKIAQNQVTQAPISNWTISDAKSLLAVINSVGEEGLDARDYDPIVLEAAIKAADQGALNLAATRVFHLLAHDFSYGHVSRARRIDWHITGVNLESSAIEGLMQAALRLHQVDVTLRALLPQHADYKALKQALAKTPATQTATLDTIRVNLERWRWMPRELGARYILVNVPAYELSIFASDEILASQRVIVGKIATPTPQFSASVTGIIVNPTWTVPVSIINESVGKLVRTNPKLAAAKGYVWSETNGVLSVTQNAGSGNALGQVKLVMNNPYSIYLHDTPSKSLFTKDARALSHGCVRVDKALEFSNSLMQLTSNDQALAIDKAVKSGVTTRINLNHPVPVYIAYFTLTANPDGSFEAYDDIYGRDKSVLVELDNKGEAEARPVAKKMAARVRLSASTC